MRHPPLPPAELVQHAGFLRALGGRLLLDPHVVEDATQATLAVGLEQGPRDVPRARGWLSRVFRNAVNENFRSGSRRTRRERAVPRSATVGSTADAVAQHEVMHRVAQAVGALPSAQREVIVLRFYDGLPPREIAARLDAPVATVKSRLARALTQLRATLDAGDRGGAAAWRYALAPIAGMDPGSFAATATGALTMNAKTSVIAAAVLAAGVGGTAVLLDIGSDESGADGAGEPPIVVGRAEPAAELSLDGEAPDDAPKAEEHGVSAEPSAGAEPQPAPRSAPGEGVAGNSSKLSTLRGKRVANFSVDQQSVSAVLSTLSVISGLNIIVDHRVAESLSGSELTLQLDDISIETILDMIASQLDVEWREVDDVIVFGGE